MSENQYSRKDLEDLICDVMGLTTITPMIRNQINKCVLEYNMSFKEIARCIVWYTEVNGKQFSSIYGIGIIVSIREETEKYFKKLELDQQRKAEEAKKVVEYQGNNIIFNIKLLKHNKRKPRQLDLNDINVKGDEE